MVGASRSLIRNESRVLTTGRALIDVVEFCVQDLVDVLRVLRPHVP